LKKSCSEGKCLSYDEITDEDEVGERIDEKFIITLKEF
jgi:hypothetical protein